MKDKEAETVSQAEIDAITGGYHGSEPIEILSIIDTRIGNPVAALHILGNRSGVGRGIAVLQIHQSNTRQRQRLHHAE